jgi:hypothetical protein
LPSSWTFLTGVESDDDIVRVVLVYASYFDFRGYDQVLELVLEKMVKLFSTAIPLFINAPPSPRILNSHMATYLVSVWFLVLDPLPVASSTLHARLPRGRMPRHDHHLSSIGSTYHFTGRILLRESAQAGSRCTENEQE